MNDQNSPLTFQGNDVAVALELIRPYVAPTPTLSKHIGSVDAVLKLESHLEPTKSFKLRGILHSALKWQAENNVDKRKLITASTGNQGISLAYVARLVHMKAVVVVPKQVAVRKVSIMEELGADVIIHGDSIDISEEFARELAFEHNYHLISSHNSLEILVGYATLVLELLEQSGDISCILVPVGGGGLLASISTCIASVAPHIKVVGVQSKSTPAMYNFLYGTAHEENPSLADGLAGGVDPNALSTKICRNLVKHMILVSEQSIRESMRISLLEWGFVLEGAGACCISALLEDQVHVQKGRIALILSGGNVGESTLNNILTKSVS